MTLTLADTDATDYVRMLRAASPERLLDMLLGATNTQARIAVEILGLRELFRLPREIVEGWYGDADTAGTARYLRSERLTTELWVPDPVAFEDMSRLWRIGDIAAAANVRRDSVSRWRGDFISGNGTWKQQLPRHTHGMGDVKEQGERIGEKGGDGIPMWQPNVVLDWLKRSRKVTSDLYPHNRKRGGGIPDGRPPKQRESE